MNGQPDIPDQPPADEVTAIFEARTSVASKFLRGTGIEVGAGARAFPHPVSARILYGDIREKNALEKYFQESKSENEVKKDEYINAETFAGIKNESLDFVISAHVIEHLRDPIGSIVNAIRVLKPAGTHILVVPDMRYTFDRDRPETTIDHVLADYADGGASTCRASYEEHLRYVHPILTGEKCPEAEIQRQASIGGERWPEFDIHFHAWTRAGFETLLGAAKKFAPFTIETTVFVVNENIFVLRKQSSETVGSA